MSSDTYAISSLAEVNHAFRRKGYSFDDTDRRSFMASTFTTLKRIEEKRIAEQVGKGEAAAIWALR